VPAVDAQKADGDSMRAIRIHSPPSLTGSDACCQCESDISTFNTTDNAFIRTLSNSERIGFAGHSDVLSVYSI